MSTSGPKLLAVRARSSRRFHASRALVAAAGLALGSGCGPEGATLEGEDVRARPVGESAREIIGGTNALITDFPWMASVQDLDGAPFCGAAILDASWLLTSRQCVLGTATNAPASPETVRIGAGSARMSTMASSGQLRFVLDVIPYPGFVDAKEGKDVALLRLSSPLTLNATTVVAIPPATPADETAGYTNPGVTATLTGWGYLNPGSSEQRDVLQKVDLSLVSNQVAAGSYGTIPITADQLAASTSSGTRYFCRNDIGDPLVVNGAAGKVLAGLASWNGSNGCLRDTRPNMFARVASFQPWIASLLGRTPTTLLPEMGVTVAQGAWKHYTVTVPAGTTAFNVSLSDGSGDGDLYVHTSQPSTTVYTCRPFVTGNTEYCSIPTPAAGTWYVSVRGRTSVSGATLRATSY